MFEAGENMSTLEKNTKVAGRKRSLYAVPKLLSISEFIRLKEQVKDSTRTFEKQADEFLERSANRKKKPVRPQTLKTYKTQIDTHLKPLLGSIPLEVIGNKLVKAVISELEVRPA